MEYLRTLRNLSSQSTDSKRHAWSHDTTSRNEQRWNSPECCNGINESPALATNLQVQFHLCPRSGLAPRGAG